VELTETKLIFARTTPGGDIDDYLELRQRNSGCDSQYVVNYGLVKITKSDP